MFPWIYIFTSVPVMIERESEKEDAKDAGYSKYEREYIENVSTCRILSSNVAIVIEECSYLPYINDEG
jgi:hypothetical protein